MDLVVDPAPDGVKLPGTGYTSGSLQDNLTISNDKGLIGGHLKYTTGMVTMYPDDRLKQEGNYIALWLHEIGDPYVNYDKIDAKVVNGPDEKELEVSDEGYICFRVDDRATTKLVVTVTIGEQTYDKEFKLTALTVDEYGWNILKGTNLPEEKRYNPADGTHVFNMAGSGNPYLETPDTPWESSTNTNTNEGLTVEFRDVTDLPNEWVKTSLYMKYIFHEPDADPVTRGFNVCTRKLPLYNGRTYTISGYVRGKITGHTNANGYTCNLTNKQLVNMYSYEVNVGELDPEKWTRFERTFTINDSNFQQDEAIDNAFIGFSGLYPQVVFPGDGVEHWIEWAGMKLEAGNHATGWDEYYSGDNLLLDTDQPDIENHNSTIPSGERYRNFSGGSGEIKFLVDSNLPFAKMLVNNEYQLTAGDQTWMQVIFNQSAQNHLTYDIKDGDPITISYYAKISQESRTDIWFRNQTTTDSERAYVLSLPSNEWTRVVHTFIVNQNKIATNPIDCALMIGLSDDTVAQSGKIIEICGVKMEKGCHVTDYRPAPSDFNINYVLNSNVEHSNEPSSSYIFAYQCINGFQNIPKGTPFIMSVDGEVGEGRSKHFGFNVRTANPATVTIGLASVPYLNKDPDFGYFGSYEFPSISDHIGENGITAETIMTGFNAYTDPSSVQAVSTIRKIKFEIGRYPTKWVDGSGEPIPSSDEDDSDLEVT